MKYKSYKKVFEKVSRKAEILYYKEQFNTESNSKSKCGVTYIWFVALNLKRQNHLYEN
jgi:hypothetical protein